MRENSWFSEKSAMISLWHVGFKCFWGIWENVPLFSKSLKFLVNVYILNSTHLSHLIASSSINHVHVSWVGLTVAILQQEETSCTVTVTLILEQRINFRCIKNSINPISLSHLSCEHRLSKEVWRTEKLVIIYKIFNILKKRFVF